MRMRPYSGATAVCPKCGWRGIAPAAYRRPGFCTDEQHEPNFSPEEMDGIEGLSPPMPDGWMNPFKVQDWMAKHPRPERLCRTCQLCGCKWDELCMEDPDRYGEERVTVQEGWDVEPPW